MTRYIQPWNLGEHRVAAIALYRNLLLSCTSAPVAINERETLQNIIRNNFKNNVRLQSHNRLKYEFVAGYEALDILSNASAGQKEAQQRLHDLLCTTKSDLMLPPPPPSPPKISKISDCPPLPPGEKTYEIRPRLNIPGPRNVPTLVNASGLYFIRFKGKQPKSLNIKIRHHVQKLEKRNDANLIMHEFHLPLATFEDAWDRSLEQIGVPQKPELENTWQKTMEDVHRMGDSEYVRYGQKLNAMGWKWLDIIKQEEALAKKEQEENPQIPVRVRKDRAQRRLLPEDIHEKQKMHHSIKLDLPHTRRRLFDTR